jgi:hypothetical protein
MGWGKQKNSAAALVEQAVVCEMCNKRGEEVEGTGGENKELCMDGFTLK